MIYASDKPIFYVPNLLSPFFKEIDGHSIEVCIFTVCQALTMLSATIADARRRGECSSSPITPQTNRTTIGVRPIHDVWYGGEDSPPVEKDKLLFATLIEFLHILSARNQSEMIIIR